MSIENTARVQLAEVHDVVQQLRDLKERSAFNGQTVFAFVFDLAAESLSENIENVADMEDADDC